MLQLQKNEGIDAVIVDSVLKVRQGLQAPSQDLINGVDERVAIVGAPLPPTALKDAGEVLRTESALYANGEAEAVLSS